MDPRPRHHLKRDLEQAERHIAEGQRHIEKQTAIVAELERDGHDSTLSKELLEILHKTLQMHKDHRENILRELQG
jgi:hypothetical protein